MKRNPHILIKNIYYMLSYAFEVLQQGNYEDLGAEDFDNVQNLFAAILGKGISQQLKQGLYREYMDQKEDLPTLRGKIDMNGTIRHMVAHRQMLTCEYDELSENNLHNKVIKATAMLLIRSDQVDKEYKDILKKEMLFFSNVDLIDPSEINWSKLRFHRNNQTYRMLINICRYVLDGMLLTEEHGEHRLASFIDDQQLWHLYEKFLREYYRKEFHELQVSAEQISWALDDGEDTLLPNMQSDITITYGNTVLIMDAKCYTHTTKLHMGKMSVSSANIYQIFSYVKNKEAKLADKKHKVSGILLYARTDESIQPEQTYQMSGNRIDVRTLDLNQDFTIIRRQLNGIIGDFFGIHNEMVAKE